MSTKEYQRQYYRDHKERLGEGRRRAYQTRKAEIDKIREDLSKMNSLFSDTLYGLYLKADTIPGLPVYAELEADLVVGLMVMPEARRGNINRIAIDGNHHRLQLSRRGVPPTLADWEALLEAMPYHLRVEPQARSHGDLHTLDVTYLVQPCICGSPRALTGGLLHACKRCGARAVYWTREEVRA